MLAPLTSTLRPWVCALLEFAILCLTIGGTSRGFAGPVVWRALVVAFAVFVCLYYNHLYEDFPWRSLVEFLWKALLSFGLSGGILALVSRASSGLHLGGPFVAASLALSFLAILCWRFLFRWGAGLESFSDRVLILGTGQAARTIAREAARRAPTGLLLLGLVGEVEAEVGRDGMSPGVVGTAANLRSLVKALNANLVVVAPAEPRGAVAMEDLLHYRLEGVRVEEGIAFHERIAGSILVHHLPPGSLIFEGGLPGRGLARRLKRAVELAGALLSLVVLVPFFALIALLIRLTSTGPVLYRQERVGEQGRPFLAVKFRSMPTGAEAASGPVWAAEGHDPRATPLGRLLRRWRLDELPQLLNVVRGEMSFVGPRPERPHFVELLRKVIPYYDERHRVRPGITGWAQIRSGYGSTIEDSERKLEFDLYYVKNMSLLLDFAILVETVRVMLPGGRDPRP